MNNLFVNGSILHAKSVKYDPIAMFYVLEISQKMVYNHSKRTTAEPYDIKERVITIKISLETPQIKSFYIVAEQNGMQVNISEVCAAIANTWSFYYDYFVLETNTNWVCGQGCEYQEVYVEKTKNECIELLQIDESQFGSDDALILYSPY